MMERFTEWDFDRKGKKVSAFTQELIIYCGDCYIGEPIDKLAHYEDLEEQGLLLKLPCKVGDTVWYVNWYWDCKYENYCPKEDTDCGTFRCEHEVRKYFIEEIEFDVQMIYGFGKTVFLTKEEAEKELQRIKGNG